MKLIFVGILRDFDGERITNPPKIFLKPYGKERSEFHFQEEGR